MFALAHRLDGLVDLPVARAAVRARLTERGVDGFARELEELLAGAAAGGRAERRGAFVVASWVAHILAAGERAELDALGRSGETAGLPLVRAVFASCTPRAALPPRARLAEVGIPVYADISGIPTRRWKGQSLEDWRIQREWFTRSLPMRLFRMRDLRPRAILHHDPVFIARLLDQKWMSARDAVAVAARRPSSAAIVVAVAARDRWLRVAAVREAVAENPFAPAVLARILWAAGARGKPIGTSIDS